MKTRMIRYALYAIPLVMFNVLFFLIAGNVHPKSVWIAYAWIQIAFLFLLVSPLLPGRTENGPVYRITLTLISATYFAVEFVIGMVVIVLRPAGIKTPIIAQCIPFFVYLIVFLTAFLFTEYAAESEKKENKDKK
jgi:hypothetical protein